MRGSRPSHYRDQLISYRTCNPVTWDNIPNVSGLWATTPDLRLRRGSIGLHIWQGLRCPGFAAALASSPVRIGRRLLRGKVCK